MPAKHQDWTRDEHILAFNLYCRFLFLTPRGAARIQSFPDWFVFPQAQTRAFHLIGNAVPRLVVFAAHRPCWFSESRECPNLSSS